MSNPVDPVTNVANPTFFQTIGNGIQYGWEVTSTFVADVAIGIFHGIQYAFSWCYTHAANLVDRASTFVGNHEGAFRDLGIAVGVIVLIVTGVIVVPKIKAWMQKGKKVPNQGANRPPQPSRTPVRTLDPARPQSSSDPGSKPNRDQRRTGGTPTVDISSSIMLPPPSTPALAPTIDMYSTTADALLISGLGDAGRGEHEDDGLGIGGSVDSPFLRVLDSDSDDEAKVG